jgi:hypothetical protein
VKQINMADSRRLEYIINYISLALWLHTIFSGGTA